MSIACSRNTETQENDSFSEYLAQFHDENVDVSNTKFQEVIKTLPKPFVNIKHEVDAINNVRSSNRLSKAFKKNTNSNGQIPDIVKINDIKNDHLCIKKETKTEQLKHTDNINPTGINNNNKMVNKPNIQSKLVPSYQNKRDISKPTNKYPLIPKSNAYTVPPSINKEIVKNPIPSNCFTNKPKVNNPIIGTSKPLLASKLPLVPKYITISNKNAIKPVSTLNNANIEPKQPSTSVQVSVNRKLVYSAVSKQEDIKSKKQAPISSTSISMNKLAKTTTTLNNRPTTSQVNKINTTHVEKTTITQANKTSSTQINKTTSQTSTTSSRLYVPSNYKDLIIQKAQDKLKKEFEKTNDVSQMVSLQEKELRKLTIHKAKPMPNFKRFEIKKAVFIPTIPKSPNFASKNTKI